MGSNINFRFGADIISLLEKYKIIDNKRFYVNKCVLTLYGGDVEIELKGGLIVNE